MKNQLLIGILLLSIAFIAACTTTETGDAMETDSMQQGDDAMTDQGKEEGAMMETGEEGTEESGDAMMDDEGAMTEGPELLAGSRTPYYVYNKELYEEALAEGKTVYLEFYADWCPICTADEPKILEFFNTQTKEDLVAFRVNYNDDDTDADEEALAEEYGITYQHTRVIIKDGQTIYRDIGSFNAGEVTDAI